MEENTVVHFRIHVYDDAPPPAEPKEIPLCPEARQNPRVSLASSVPQVTCRRCLQLLDVLGLRPLL